MPDTDSTVRLATPADLPAMHTMLALTLSAEPGMLGFGKPQEARHWLTSRNHIRLWTNYLQQLPDQMAMLVATTPSGQIVGFTDGSVSTTRLKSVPKWHNCMLNRLIVHPAHRGQGYGSALLDGFAARARTIGCEGMMLIVYASQHTAIALYKRNGYEIRRTGTDDDSGLPYHHMSRPLELPCTPLHAAA